MENFNAMIEKAQPLFDKIAEKIGQGATWGWDVLIRQQYVIAAQNAIGAIIAGVALYWGIRAIRKAQKAGYHDCEEGYWILGSLLTAGGAIAMTICLLSATGHIINPGYYALKTLAAFVTGNVTPE